MKRHNVLNASVRTALILLLTFMSASIFGCGSDTTSDVATEDTTISASYEGDHDNADLDKFDYVDIDYSACFDRVGYDGSTLYVRFLDSQSEYLYFDVPEDEYKDMLSAKSIGKYYNQNIKGQYECERIS